MVILCLRWWYSAGWQWVWQRVLIDRLVWINEVFSTKDLVRTIFAPYRQTFAGNAKGSPGDLLRAFADRSISRIIGATVRLILIIAALIGSLLIITVGLATLLIWPILPVLPLVGIVGILTGVGV